MNRGSWLLQFNFYIRSLLFCTVQMFKIAVIMSLMSSIAHAGSFSLYTESTASAIGNYAAGIAAEAADASTGWYNPAGLALIHEQQMVLGGVGVFPVSQLTGVSTFSTPTLLELGFPDYIETFNHLNGAEHAFVPSFHYALPLGENAAVGLSVVTPFGLMTNWSNTGPVRYAATRSQLITVNISPEIGGSVTEHFAVGGGIDFQSATVKFNSELGSPVFMEALPLEPNAIDSRSDNEGDSFALGFHAGIMGLFNDNHTRLGFNYQSNMNHQFFGSSRLTGFLAFPGFVILDTEDVLSANPNAVFLSNHLYSNDINLPSISTFSIYQDVNEKWAVLGSIVYTAWDPFQLIELNNIAAYVFPPGQTEINFVSPENYHNAWRAAIGANYYLNEQSMIRLGGGYDQTPTSDADRDIRVPDGNRWAASIGAHYQWLPSLGLDLGYTHLFVVDNPRINRTDTVGINPTSTYNVNAQINGYANLVGVQLTWIIDPLPLKK